MVHRKLTNQKANKVDWRAAFWFAQSLRIGVVPLPIYLLLTLLIIGFVSIDKVSSDLTMAIGILSVGGFFFMELGRRIPILGLMGGAAIMTFVVPSAAVFYGVIPPSVAAAVTTFCKQSNFLYLYISAIIVGSIISMDRQVLVQGFLKILVPLAAGSIVAFIVGTLVGMAMGLTASHSLFFIVAPIMAGGLGEGAIPLSVGLFSHPASAAGYLVRTDHPSRDAREFYRRSSLRPTQPAGKISSKPLEIKDVAAAGITIVSLYLLGVYIQKLTAFPAPITMLFLVVAAKIGRLFDEVIENGSRQVYRFFSTIVTWPLLFAMGVALTPWDTFIAVFTLPTVVTVFATVSSLIATGFITARWVRLYPIDTAIVAGCHSGQGGTGDIAILTASNRMELMPFAQIATRIGGAVTVSFAIMMLRFMV